jgi:hypothetical protein
VVEKGWWVHRKTRKKMIGITVIRMKRGVQGNRSQVGVSEKESRPQEKKWLKIDRYRCDQDEKRSPMG